MTKKIIVLVIAIVLCLSVVGGCFALYYKDATNLVINFGSEDAVTLTLAADGGAINFGNVVLNPTSNSATQKVTLDVSGAKEQMAGLNGELKISLGGTLDSSYYVLSGVAKGAGDSAEDVNYEQAQLTSGVTLPLDDLPQYLTLTIALTDAGKTNEGFKAASNKNITVSVSWKVVDWAPVDGGYYIIGTKSGWGVNKNAILLDGDLTGQTDKARKLNVTLEAGEEYKVVRYTTAGGIEWLAAGDSMGAGVNGTYTQNITVDTTGTYFVCYNQYDQVWIQTMSSMG